MIEPFEFESIRLQAPQPHGTAGQQVLLGNGSIDEQEMKSFSALSASDDTIPMDKERLRIFQNKIGNPLSIDPHAAVHVPERLVAQGAIAPNYVEPTEEMRYTTNTSALLSSFLDQDMTYIPSTDKHKPTGMHINNPRINHLNPGITTIDSRKIAFNWMN